MNSDFCVAVHGMVYLNHKNCQLSSEELAENICTNPARVRKVMAKLKKKNLVQTKEGQLRILALQIPGKKRMDTGAFLRGYPVQKGLCLGRTEEAGL